MTTAAFPWRASRFAPGPGRQMWPASEVRLAASGAGEARRPQHVGHVGAAVGNGRRGEFAQICWQPGLAGSPALERCAGAAGRSLPRTATACRARRRRACRAAAARGCLSGSQSIPLRLCASTSVGAALARTSCHSGEGALGLARTTVQVGQRATAARPAAKNGPTEARGPAGGGLLPHRQGSERPPPAQAGRPACTARRASSRAAVALAAGVAPSWPSWWRR